MSFPFWPLGFFLLEIRATLVGVTLERALGFPFLATRATLESSHLVPTTFSFGSKVRMISVMTQKDLQVDV